jgi:DNA-binding CsgD family transcriptional regulator
VLAIDGESLLFTRLLAYRGERLPHFAFFLRDVYLVSREPEWLSIERLLTEGGGSAAFHEGLDRWLRAPPPEMTQRAFTRYWRKQLSPAGGGLRFGIAHRRRWLGVLQLARWEPGPGFTASQLELLDRLAPALGVAFARHLVGAAAVSGGPEPPPPGQLLFDARRRLAVLDESAEAWLARLPDDGLQPFGVDVPVAVQSVVNHLSAGAETPARSRVADRYGLGVTIRGERARRLRPGRSASASALYSVTVSRTPWGPEHPALVMLTARQRDIATAVAEGLGDERIAKRLGVGPATVHDQVMKLHRLVGTTTRPGLVATLNRS